VKTRLRAARIVGALTLTLAMSVAASPVRADQPARTETPVQSAAPNGALVTETYVSLLAPLPAASGPRPAACDRLGYLRFRSAQGPSDPTQAAAIFVAQPGIFEGAGAFDQLARDVIRMAAAGGRQVEFWALDRRSNCLEDHVGVQAAARAHDPQVAIDYYYNGGTVDGQTFPGFVKPQDARFLSTVGLGQTVRDEMTVISQLPPSVRQSKVLCGGHSLGGPITAAFASWDFDGNPATTADDGFNQCAGYFGLDTRLAIGSQSLLQGLGLTSSILPGTGLGSLFQIASGGSPFFNTPPFTPETFRAVPIIGIGSFNQPDQASTIQRKLPNDLNFNTTLRLLFSRDLVNFATGIPDIRQFNLTNQALAGALFDDNSQPVGILRASLGVPTGGEVVRKNFPLPYGTPSTANGLLGGNKLIAPSQPNGPLYRWLNYNQVPSPPPSPADDPGHPYTSARSEVTDVQQLSRTLFEAPADFTEDYFPTRLLLDIEAASNGDRTGDLQNLRQDGVSRHPAAYVDAEEGIAPSQGAPAQGPQPSVLVVAPGYNHLDVLTAAAQQTNGQPEISSSTLALFMSQLVG
jgi:hypothetical protein